MAAHVDINKVKKLLAQGLAPSAIARIVSCDPSYISQLTADPAFMQEVTSARIEQAESIISQDEKVLQLRGQVIDKLEEAISISYKLPELLNAFNVLDKAKSHSGIGEYQPQSESAIVNLHLPNVQKLNFVMSPDKQVIEIEGRPMIRAQAPQILNMVKAKENERLLAITTAELASEKEDRNRIPTIDEIAAYPTKVSNGT